MRITVEFKPDRDADILTWLEEQRNWSEAIREALRRHLTSQQGVTLDDVYAAIRKLERRIESGARIEPTPETDCGGDAPGTSEAAANLSHLGL